MVAERVDNGVSFIPRSDGMVQTLLKPTMVHTIQEAPPVSKSNEIVTVHTEFTTINSSLASNARSIPDRFAELLNFDDVQTKWTERKRRTPTKRDIKVYLGFNSKTPQESMNSFPGIKVIHPTESAVASVISEQGIDTTRPGDNSVPVVIRTTGLITHKFSKKPLPKYSKEIVEQALITLNEDGNPVDSNEAYRVGVETSSTEIITDQRIIAVTFDRSRNFKSTSGLISLSFHEYLKAQEQMGNYNIGREIFDMLAFLPNQDSLQTPGYITQEMIARSKDVVGIYFHRSADGKIYFGSDKLSPDSEEFIKIQRAATAIGLEIKQQWGSEFFSMSFTPNDNSDYLYKWGVPIPQKLSL